MLELAGLVRRFGTTVALDGMGFQVPTGAIWGFVGRNGAGKTTAMRIALGLLTADAGTVTWKGAPMDATLRARAGHMPEERGLYPKMRVSDQLAYFATLHGYSASDARAAADRWVARVGLEDRGRDRVEALSLGNQQRVQLGAALVHDPELLILDEPFSGLDPVAVDTLAAVLGERASAGVTTLFSSHQLELVERVCDGVAIIEHGRLVASGTIDELRSRDRTRFVRIGHEGVVDWSALAGVRVVEVGAGSTVLDLSPEVDDQEVLSAALAVGRVSEFTPVRPSIADLFRASVDGPE